VSSIDHQKETTDIISDRMIRGIERNELHQSKTGSSDNKEGKDHVYISAIGFQLPNLRPP